MNLLNDICKSRNGEIKDQSYSNFSLENDMDPKLNLLNFQNLPELSEIEEMFASRVHVLMKRYRLESGSIGCKGNVLNLEQNVKKPSTLYHLMQKNFLNLFLGKNNVNSPEGCKDFKARRWAIRNWLVFFK